MAEYIEKKDLLKVLPPKCNMGDMYATAYNTCLNTIENLIKEQPTADVVPVVRCCNCIHLKTYTGKDNYCDIHSVAWDKFFVRLDDFCSYGERRCSG